MKQSFITLFFLTLLFFISTTASLKAQSSITQDLKGRLGIGMSQQLINDIPSLSLKLQRSNKYAFGLLLGLKNSEIDDGLGAGVRLYRTFFDEPLLNFYGAGTLAFISKKINSITNSGFQVDLTLGSEFHFAGLESIGFSFEFGMSINKFNDNFTLETIGLNVLQAGIHFYI